MSRRAPSSAIKVVNSGRETLYWPYRDGVAGGVAFPEPDVSNIGGISAWMKVAELAAAHGLSVTSHGVHELHVAPAGGGAQRLLPGSVRIRDRVLRASTAATGVRRRAAARPARSRRGVRPGAAGAERMTGGGTELLPGNEATVNIQGLAYHVA